MLVFFLHKIDMNVMWPIKTNLPLGSAVSFSPDPAALRSILQNEGVRAGGATPRVSTCLTGRGTSIYSVSLLGWIRLPVYNEGVLHHVAFFTSGPESPSEKE